MGEIMKEMSQTMQYYYPFTAIVAKGMHFKVSKLTIGGYTIETVDRRGAYH
jgi:hypothetical protein